MWLIMKGKGRYFQIFAPQVFHINECLHVFIASFQLQYLSIAHNGTAIHIHKIKGTKIQNVGEKHLKYIHKAIEVMTKVAYC